MKLFIVTLIFAALCLTAMAGPGGYHGHYRPWSYYRNQYPYRNYYRHSNYWNPNSHYYRNYGWDNFNYGHHGYDYPSLNRGGYSSYHRSRY